MLGAIGGIANVSTPILLGTGAVKLGNGQPKYQYPYPWMNQ